MGREDTMQTAIELDAAFEKLRQVITEQAVHARKEHRVRANVWLAKIGEQTNNIVWKRNRNQYARLLLEQLRAGVLEAPFDALPPNGGLPTLQPYLIYRFISPAGRSNSPPLRQSPLKVNHTHASTHTQPTHIITGITHENVGANDTVDSHPELNGQEGGVCMPTELPEHERAQGVQSVGYARGSPGTSQRAATTTPKGQNRVRSNQSPLSCRTGPDGDSNAHTQPAATAAAVRCDGAAVITAGSTGGAGSTLSDFCTAADGPGAARAAAGGSGAVRAAAKAHLDILINRFEQRRAQWELDAAKERAAAQCAAGEQLPVEAMLGGGMDDMGGTTRQSLHPHLTTSPAAQQQQQQRRRSDEKQGNDPDTKFKGLQCEAEGCGDEGGTSQTAPAQVVQKPQQAGGLRLTPVAREHIPARDGKSIEAGCLQSPRSVSRPRSRGRHLQWLRQSADSVLYRDLTALMKEIDQEVQKLEDQCGVVDTSSPVPQTHAALSGARASQYTPTSHFKVSQVTGTGRENQPMHGHWISPRVSCSRTGAARRSLTPPGRRPASNISPVVRAQDAGLSAGPRLRSQASLTPPCSRHARISPMSLSARASSVRKAPSSRHGLSQPGYVTSPGGDSFSFTPAVRVRASTPGFSSTGKAVGSCTGMLDRLLGTRAETDMGLQLSGDYGNHCTGQMQEPAWVHTPATELVGKLSSKAAHKARCVGSQTPSNTPCIHWETGQRISAGMCQADPATSDWVAGLPESTGDYEARSQSQPGSPIRSAASPRAGGNMLGSEQLLTHQCFVQQQAREAHAGWQLQVAAAAAAIHESQQAVAAYSLALGQKQARLKDLLCPEQGSVDDLQLLSPKGGSTMEAALTACHAGVDAVSTQLGHCLHAFHVGGKADEYRHEGASLQERGRSISMELRGRQSSVLQRGCSLDARSSASCLSLEPGFLQKLQKRGSSGGRSVSPHTVCNKDQSSGLLHSSPWRPSGPSRSPTPPRSRAASAGRVRSATQPRCRQSTDSARQTAAIAALRDATAALRQQVKLGVKSAQKLLMPLLSADPSRDHCQHSVPVDLTASMQRLARSSQTTAAATLATRLLEEILTETADLVGQLKQCAGLLQEASSAGQLQATSSMDNVRRSLEAASLRHSTGWSSSPPGSPVHSPSGLIKTCVDIFQDPPDALPYNSPISFMQGPGTSPAKMQLPHSPYSAATSTQGRSAGRHVSPCSTPHTTAAEAATPSPATAEVAGRYPCLSPFKSVTAALLSDAESVLSSPVGQTAAAGTRASSRAGAFSRAASTVGKSTPVAGSPVSQTRVRLFDTPGPPHGHTLTPPPPHSPAHSPLGLQGNLGSAYRPRTTGVQGAMVTPESVRSQKSSPAPACSAAGKVGTVGFASEVQELLCEAAELGMSMGKQCSSSGNDAASSLSCATPSPAVSVSAGRGIAAHMAAAMRHAQAVASEQDPLMVLAKRHEPLLPDSVLRSLRSCSSTPTFLTPPSAGSRAVKHSPADDSTAVKHPRADKSSVETRPADGSSHVSSVVAGRGSNSALTLLPPHLLKEVLSIPEQLLMDSHSVTPSSAPAAAHSRSSQQQGMQPAPHSVAGASPIKQVRGAEDASRGGCVAAGSSQAAVAVATTTAIAKQPRYLPQPSSPAVAGALRASPTRQMAKAQDSPHAPLLEIGKSVTLLSPQMLADLRLDADLAQPDMHRTQVEQLIAATSLHPEPAAISAYSMDRASKQQQQQQQYHTTASVYAASSDCLGPAAEASLAELAAGSRHSLSPKPSPKFCPKAHQNPTTMPATASAGSMPMRTVVEDLNAVYRRGVNSLRAAHSENMQTLEAFQSAKRAMGLHNTISSTPAAADSTSFPYPGCNTTAAAKTADRISLGRLSNTCPLPFSTVKRCTPNTQGAELSAWDLVISPSKLVQQALQTPAIAPPAPSAQALAVAAATAHTAFLEQQLVESATRSAFSADVWAMLQDLELRTQQLKQHLHGGS